MHGGLGKNFVSSAVAELAPLMPGDNLDERISVLRDHYQRWSKTAGGHKLHYSKFDRETFGITSLQVCPTGAWSKFADTRVFLDLLEHFLSTSDQYEKTPIAQNILAATTAANRCFRTLYHGGLWLNAEESKSAGKYGLLFLKLYSTLARVTLANHRDRFAMTPKLHYLHHSFLELYQRADNQSWTLSPLGVSVQIDEDNGV